MVNITILFMHYSMLFLFMLQKTSLAVFLQTVIQLWHSGLQLVKYFISVLTIFVCGLEDYWLTEPWNGLQSHRYCARFGWTFRKSALGRITLQKVNSVCLSWFHTKYQDNTKTCTTVQQNSEYKPKVAALLGWEQSAGFVSLAGESTGMFG